MKNWKIKEKAALGQCLQEDLQLSQKPAQDVPIERPSVFFMYHL